MLRRRGAPHAVTATVALVALALLAGACSFLSDDAVDVGVPGVQARWLDLSGLSDRRALVVAPDGVRPDESGQARVPLVVVLHGLGGDAESMARSSGWSAAARDHGFVVAFGQGESNSFDAHGCCGEAASDGVDDVDYVRRVIDDVADTFPVDRDRVFLTGYSNGGMLTYLFTCDHADLLAGAASIAGTNLTGCDPSDPVSFLQVSGTDDEIVPVDGGESKAPGLGPFPSVVGSVEGVAAAQRCGSPARTTADSVTSTRWSDCEDGTTVGLDLIAGADHTEPIAGDHPATPLVLAFWGLAGAG